MSSYVAGFAFNPDHTKVMLIRKIKPTWQKGRLNGVGGKIEAGELPIEAMVREFQEEAGIITTMGDWRRYCLLTDRLGNTVDFFCGRFVLLNGADYNYTVPEGVNAELDREMVHVVNPTWAMQVKDTVLPNIPWLLAMAMNMDREPMVMRFCINEMGRMKV